MRYSLKLNFLTRLALIALIASVTLAPMALMAVPLNEPFHPQTPPPVIELPTGSTIISIISQIVKHNDLRDTDFITGLLGVSPSQTKDFMYKIKSKRFYFKYDKFDPPAHFDQTSDATIAGAGFHNILGSPCIQFTDFSGLFSAAPKESPSRILGGIDYTFQKDVGPESYLILTIPTKNSCAWNISVAMHQKKSALNLNKGK